MSDQLRCERCQRFIGEDCLEGWTGGVFGDYNGLYFCAAGRGCNADSVEADELLLVPREHLASVST